MDNLPAHSRGAADGQPAGGGCAGCPPATSPSILVKKCRNTGSGSGSGIARGALGQGAKAPATPLVIRRDLSQALGAVGLPARYQLARLIPMLSQGFDALRDAP